MAKPRKYWNSVVHYPLCILQINGRSYQQGIQSREKQYNHSINPEQNQTTVYKAVYSPCHDELVATTDGRSKEIQTPCLLLWLQGKLSQATIPVTTTNCVSYTDHSVCVCASLPQKIHSIWCEKGKATVVDLLPTTPSFIILISL